MSATELRTASVVDVLGLRLLSLAGAATEAAGGTASVEAEAEAGAEAGATSLPIQYVANAPYFGNTMVQFFWSWALVTAPVKVQSKLG